MTRQIATFALAGVLAAATTAAAAPLTDAQATALMTKAGCNICHSVDKKLVGPSYMEVSKKHKGDKAAPAALLKKVREGGTGVYGPIPMPPNPVDKINDADLTALIAWVLTK